MQIEQKLGLFIDICGGVISVAVVSRDQNTYTRFAEKGAVAVFKRN